MTTILDQSKAIKAKYKDAILLFRVGDYYETFDTDATAAASALEGLCMTTKMKQKN